MTNEEIIAKALDLLISNTEWDARYARYAEKVKKNLDDYEITRNKFRAIKPFSAYTSISKAMNGLEYDIRFKGQSLGCVRVKENNVLFYPGEKYDWFENQGLSFPKIEKGADWNSKEVSEYRSILKNNDSTLKPKSPEHEVENKLLYEFHKQSGENKSLTGIQPVILAGNFFQMPTPFKASSHDPEYSGSGGGGIDILARIEHSKHDCRLCIMEVKDETNTSEPQSVVIQQALTYATFIANLLRSESKEIWWSLFGFKSNLPEHLHIDVVSLMPEKQVADGHVDSEYVLEGLDCTLHTYSLYFDENKLKNREMFEFTGTLPKQIERNQCKQSN